MVEWARVFEGGARCYYVSCHVRSVVLGVRKKQAEARQGFDSRIWADFSIFHVPFLKMLSQFSWMIPARTSPGSPIGFCRSPRRAEAAPLAVAEVAASSVGGTAKLVEEGRRRRTRIGRKNLAVGL